MGDDVSQSIMDNFKTKETPGAVSHRSLKLLSLKPDVNSCSLHNFSKKENKTNQTNKQRNRGWFVTETLRKPKVKNPKCAFHVEISLEEIQIPI